MDCRRYEPIFGSWYITEELGSGAEGSLYRICQTDALGHKFYSALKAVSVPSSKSEIGSLMAGGMRLEEVAEYYEGVLKNTTQEFELLEKLKGNSNIVSYEDHEIFRHEDGIGWDILIRLEELTPLVRYSIYNPLSADEVARMGIDICRGLSLCKKYGIVHRDIKPDNIFISSSGSYKLGDFGIARIIEKSTTGLSRKGTYEYMAPEVYWGSGYGASVDIYSLGIVMYRYLNDGRTPFMPQSPAPIQPDDREEAFIKRVNGHEMPAPRHGSEELKRIVLKACAFDREERYMDPGEMQRDLEMLFADSVREGADNAKASAGTVNGGKKRKKTVLIAAALCLLIACAVWIAIPKEVTDIDAGNAEGSAEIYIGDDLALSCTVKPDRFRDEPVTFTSGDESVFTVDENGAVHALATGEATLTMTAKEYSEEVVISVVPKVTSISGIDETISLTTGDTLELKPVLAPEKFAKEPVSYSTGDEKVAAVSKDGKLTAAAAGETKLTVTAGGCTFKAKVSVEDPVVYTPPSTSGKSKKKTTSSTKKKSSKKSSKGYFDSSDDEHF
ncbi:MAG: protein kinase [Lachnospiraceae bacterium]|nr:protein kinase [Lachnospiraceae bacterium]